MTACTLYNITFYTPSTIYYRDYTIGLGTSIINKISCIIKIFIVTFFCFLCFNNKKMQRFLLECFNVSLTVSNFVHAMQVDENALGELRVKISSSFSQSPVSYESD